MKKRILLLLLVASICCFLTSCATAGLDNKMISVGNLKSITGDDVAEIEVSALLYPDKTLLGSGTWAYATVIKNKTNSVISINWSKTSINYNMKSSLPFIEGQKYVNAHSPMSNSIIPVDGKYGGGIYAADQVRYDKVLTKSWTMDMIPAFDTTLTIAIEHDKGITYYTYSFSLENAVPYEK